MGNLEHLRDIKRADVTVTNKPEISNKNSLYKHNKARKTEYVTTQKTVAGLILEMQIIKNTEKEDVLKTD